VIEQSEDERVRVKKVKRENVRETSRERERETCLSGGSPLRVGNPYPSKERPYKLRVICN
jgi:hypothetical protein